MAAAIRSAESDVGCDEVPGTSASSNIDEYEGEMQVFVQQHLLSLLQPVNASLFDMQDQLNRLRSDVTARHVSIDEKMNLIQRHELALQTLGTDLGLTNQKANRMHTELSQMIEITGKATRERAEAMCTSLDEQLQDVAARTRALDAWQVEAMDADDGSGYIRELLSKMTLMQARSVKNEGDIAELQTGFEGLNHCNLGLSQRLESAKMKLDDASKDLHKVMETTSSHIEQSKLSHAASSKTLAHMQERVMVVCLDFEGQKSRLADAEAEVKNLWDSIGKVENEVNDEENALGAMKNEMLELQKLDSRSAIRELSKVCDNLGERFDELAAASSMTMVKNELSKLNDDVDKALRGIAENAASTEKVHHRTLQHASTFKQILEEQGNKDKKQDDMTEGVSLSLTRMWDKINAMMETDTAMKAHIEELHQWTSRVQRCEEGVHNNDTGVKTLFDDLASTNEKIARASNRLNLAHGGLKGMTKGISEAQKRAAEDGVVPTDKSRVEEICLPGLPGTLPRRPATSMI